MQVFKVLTIDEQIRRLIKAVSSTSANRFVDILSQLNGPDHDSPDDYWTDRYYTEVGYLIQSLTEVRREFYRTRKLNGVDPTVTDSQLIGYFTGLFEERCHTIIAKKRNDGPLVTMLQKLLRHWDVSQWLEFADAISSLSGASLVDDFDWLK
jgi:hypothetical protein